VSAATGLIAFYGNDQRIRVQTRYWLVKASGSWPLTMKTTIQCSRECRADVFSHAELQYQIAEKRRMIAQNSRHGGGVITILGAFLDALHK
jgi:hypothetical protein